MTPKEKAIVIALIRRASIKWLPRFQALTKARITKGKYKCNKCKEEVGTGQYNVDHKTPVVPTSGWDSWDGFIERLFCSTDKLQILCKPCHKAKSKKENEERS